MNDSGKQDEFILEDFDDDSERYCWSCGGRHWRVTCIDDLCYGQDECIHGDPPTPCRECNPKGELEDTHD